MAAKFARERMVQICKDDPNLNPSTVVHNFFVVVLFCFLFRREFWQSSLLIGFVLSKRVALEAVNLEHQVKVFLKNQ